MEKMNKHPLQELLDEARKYRKENSKLDNDGWVNRTAGVRNHLATWDEHQRKEFGSIVSRAKLENPHPTRGKKLPQKWLDSMSKSSKGHKKKDTTKMNKVKMKPLMTEQGPFASVQDAQKHFGYKWEGNCRHKIDKKHKGWYWLTKEQYIELTGLNPWSD